MNELITENSDKPAKELKKKSSLLSRLTRREPNTKKEERAKEKEIDKDLKAIYKDSQGNMPNLTKLDFSPKNRRRNLIIALLAALVIIFSVTILGFWVFKPSPNFSGKKVSLEIKAPFTLNSGDKINYQIRITNNEGVSLTKTELTVNLPSGFIFINSNLPPQDKPNQNPNIKVWKINDLFMEQSQIIDINGTLVGPVGSNQALAASLSYIPANFSSEFQKDAGFTTQINDSLATSASEYSTQVANAEIIEIKVKISNKSEEMTLSGLEVDLNFPAEFSLLETQVLATDAKPKPLDAKALNAVKPDLSPKITAISALLPQEEKTILYRGKFTVSDSKNIDLDLQLKLKGAGDQNYLQKEDKLTFEVIKGELLTNLIIQGSNQDKAVNFGDTLSYLLTIANKSQKTLSDLKVRAVIDSPLINWKSLADSNKGVQEDNQILWTTDQIPTLANLLPGEETDISFQIKLKNLADIQNYKPEDLLVKSYFETQINKVNNADSQLTADSNTIVNQLNTDLAFNSEARYFGANNETLGAGPLPPIVGQKTTYKVFWKLTNSLNEISNIIIKAKLPSYMVYENQKNISTGDLAPNQNNEIVWQISRIPTSVKQATAEFAISLTPQSGDVGKILTLLQEGTVIATDSQTKGQITLTFQGLTTNLDSDPLAKGKGLIQAE